MNITDTENNLMKECPKCKSTLIQKMGNHYCCMDCDWNDLPSLPITPESKAYQDIDKLTNLTDEERSLLRIRITDEESQAMINCIHKNMKHTEEGTGDPHSWYSFCCPDCGFHYDDSWGGTIKEAEITWKEYVQEMHQHNKIMRAAT